MTKIRQRLPQITEKLSPYILLVSICLAGIICLLLFPGIYLLSDSFASINPTVAYMQYPILVFCWLILLGILVAIVLAFILVLKSSKQEIFSLRTVRLLKYISLSLLFSLLSSLGMTIYSYAELGSETGLVGGYMKIFTFGLFAILNLIYFLTNLFAKAVAFKEENDLVV